MSGFLYTGALVLAGVFAVAGMSKTLRPAETSESFAALGLPAPELLSRAVPAAEIAIAALLAAVPQVGGVLAVVVLAGFTVVIGRAVHAGANVPCACFGSVRSEPVSATDVVRNSMLELLAIGAVASGEPASPTLGAATAMIVVVAGGVGILTLIRRSA